jgi:uncharacterized protein (DUF362 family)
MTCKKLDRRDFLKNMALAGASLACINLAGCGKEGAGDTAEKAAGYAMKGGFEKDVGLAVARGGDDPAKLVQAAVEAVGGMKRFVSAGDVVIVKPNIGWNRTPEQAANTNPLVVEAVVRMCVDAGAGKVKVFDSPCNPARRTYMMSGIEEAASRAGAEVYYMDERKFKDVSIPGGESLKSWNMYTEAFEADVLINVPILKHHSMARVTMGMKNLMGLLGGNRSAIHPGFDQKLADVNTVLVPHLTILDAFRVLKAHGPNSGTPEDVDLTRHVIVGADPVAVDSYGAALFGRVTGRELKGPDIGYIRIGHEMGLGEMDLARVDVKEIDMA